MIERGGFRAAMKGIAPVREVVIRGFLGALDPFATRWFNPRANLLLCT